MLTKCDGPRPNVSAPLPIVFARLHHVRVSTRLLALANSYKNPGRCLAGVDDRDSWVRPVSDADGGAVTHSLRLNGQDVQPGDSLQLELGDAVPQYYQAEDVLLVSNDIQRVAGPSPVELRDRLRRIAADVPAFAETPRTSIHRDEYNAGFSSRSLALLPTEEVSISWQYNYRDVLRPRISFESAGYGWTRLPYTGNQWVGFPPRAEGSRAVFQASYVTLSVAQPLDSGEHYVLVAGVIGAL